MGLEIKKWTQTVFSVDFSPAYLLGVAPSRPPRSARLRG